MCIYTDGSETKEHGSGWAFKVKLKGKLIHTERGKSAGNAQQAEVMALHKALEWAVKEKLKQVNCVTDSDCFWAMTVI